MYFQIFLKNQNFILFSYLNNLPDELEDLTVPVAEPSNLSLWMIPLVMESGMAERVEKNTFIIYFT